MRIARSAERRWTAPLAVALLALMVAATIALLASQAWAAEQPAPTAEVCAPGAMTITRDGPVVYDGVDCDLGPHAATPSTVVPSGTILRPAAPSSPSPSSDATSPAESATARLVSAPQFTAAIA